MPSASPLIQRARLLVDSTGAAAGFKKGVSAAKGWALGLVGAAAAAAALTKAITVLNERVERSIERYEAQEKALIRLEDRFGSATAGIVAQGEALTKLTGVSTLAITEAQALAGAMGATEANINKLALGALNLSAAFGSDLGEASRQLSVTLSGLGGELSEKIPELRALTVEQLKAGAAADVINKKFANAAAEGLTDYERLLLRIENAQIKADVAQGKAITTSDGFTDALERNVRVQEAYAEQVKDGSVLTTAYATFVEGLKAEWAGFNGVVESSARVLGALGTSITEATMDTSRQVTVVNDLTIAVEESAAATGLWATIVGLFRQDMAALNAVIGPVVSAVDSLTESTGRQATVVVGLAGALTDTVGPYDDLGDAAGRLAAKNRIVIRTQDQLNQILGQGMQVVGDAADVYERLGVVTETQVNEAIAENNRLLVLAEMAYRQGARTAADYERAVRQTAQANQDLRDSLLEAEPELDEFGNRFVTARGQVEGLTGALGLNTGAIQRNAAAAASAAAAESERRPGGFLGFGFGENVQTIEFTTATGGAELRAQIERRAGLAAAGPAQLADINLRGRTVPVPTRVMAA